MVAALGGTGPTGAVHLRCRLRPSSSSLQLLQEPSKIVGRSSIKSNGQSLKFSSAVLGAGAAMASERASERSREGDGVLPIRAEATVDDESIRERKGWLPQRDTLIWSTDLEHVERSLPSSSVSCRRIKTCCLMRSHTATSSFTPVASSL